MPLKYFEHVNPEEDHYVTIENGLRIAHKVAATEDEKNAAEVAALQRELVGVDHRLAHLDDPVPDWFPYLPNPAQIEKTREGLKNTRKTILEKLAKLGAPVNNPKRRGGK